MKKVLVTGASGFIGRHTLELLKNSGYEVHALSRKLQIAENYYWHQADILNTFDISKLIEFLRPTHLLHLAWDLPHKNYLSSLDNYKWVSASFNLIDSFNKFGGKRVVVSGTCAEYEWKSNYMIEDVTNLSFQNPYAASKNILQQLTADFAGNVGMSCAWGRIFWIYGPGEDGSRLIPSAIQNLLRNNKFMCRNAQSTRDFLHVQDVASAFVKLLSSDINGRINIASGQPITIRGVLNRVEKIMGKRNLIQYYASKDEAPFVIADTTKLNKALDWFPKIKLDEGIENTLQYWKHSLGGNDE
ncbi:NAD(P)-dependent oxidoreductase [Paenibacillus sp. FSL R7-0297]|uniref:NAD-dependent epimerase/dehydratase family protein n=1 Tax=Paenibacillus sp. FSL R7-0297 TaxID=2921680 RepID=UPI0030F7C7C3